MDVYVYTFYAYLFTLVTNISGVGDRMTQKLLQTEHEIEKLLVTQSINTVDRELLVLTHLTMTGCMKRVIASRLR